MNQLMNHKILHILFISINPITIVFDYSSLTNVPFYSVPIGRDLIPNQYWEACNHDENLIVSGSISQFFPQNQLMKFFHPL